VLTPMTIRIRNSSTRPGIDLIIIIIIIIIIIYYIPLYSHLHTLIFLVYKRLVTH
jgi:hypothetical protein